MIPVREADRLLAPHRQDYGLESVPLERAAGRVLREDIPADRDLPPGDRVTMDGVAVTSSAWEAGLREFSVQAVVPAGVPPPPLAGPDRAIHVMTGALLPPGADCVVPVEETEDLGERVRLRPETPPRPGQCVHRQGSDLKRGDLAIPAGVVLGSPEILAAAAVGHTALRVAAPPSISVLSTGDELVPADAQPGPHQVRVSNAHALAAAVSREFSARPVLHHLRDDPADVRQGLAAALAESRVLLLSGGVSAGRLDLLPAALAELGVRNVFHGVRQRPGKPFWFGVAGDGAAVFALPGNPVSTLVCYHRYVRPFLLRNLGARPEPAAAAVLTEAVDFPSPLTYFMPVRDAGQGRVVPAVHHGSGDFASLAGTAGFVELDADQPRFEAGAVVPFFRWR
jgi:molybdopterin molybdotransferase